MRKLTDLIDLLEYWLTEVRVTRSRRAPSRVRLKRKRYYRRHKSRLKRLARRRSRRPRNKRLAKRRAKIRRRLHIRPGSRRRIHLATGFEPGNMVMEAFVKKEELVRGFENVAQLLEGLIEVENKPLTESRSIDDPTKLLSGMPIPLSESEEEIMGEFLGIKTSIEEAHKPKFQIYDNGGKTHDRYTLVVDRAGKKEFYSLSHNALSHQGVNQFAGTEDDGIEAGPHLGKKIGLKTLPKEAQKAVIDRVGHHDLKEHQNTDMEQLRDDSLFLASQVQEGKISEDEALDLLEMFTNRVDEMYQSGIDEDDESDKDFSKILKSEIGKDNFKKLEVVRSGRSRDDMLIGLVKILNTGTQIQVAYDELHNEFNDSDLNDLYKHLEWGGKIDPDHSISRKTVVKILKPNAKNPYSHGPEGEDEPLYHVFLDVFSSAAGEGAISVGSIMKDHEQPLEYYQDHLPTLEKDGLIKIEKNVSEEGYDEAKSPSAMLRASYKGPSKEYSKNQIKYYSDLLAKEKDPKRIEMLKKAIAGHQKSAGLKVTEDDENLEKKFHDEAAKHFMAGVRSSKLGRRGEFDSSEVYDNEGWNFYVQNVFMDLSYPEAVVKALIKSKEHEDHHDHGEGHTSIHLAIGHDPVCFVEVFVNPDKDSSSIDGHVEVLDTMEPETIKNLGKALGEAIVTAMDMVYKADKVHEDMSEAGGSREQREDELSEKLKDKEAVAAAVKKTIGLNKWINYGDFTPEVHGGMWIKFDGKEFHLVETDLLSNLTHTDEDMIIVKEANVDLDDIAKDGDNVISFSDASQGKDLGGQVVWLMASWIAYYGGHTDEYKIDDPDKLKKEYYDLLKSRYGITKSKNEDMDSADPENTGYMGEEEKEGFEDKVTNDLGHNLLPDHARATIREGKRVYVHNHRNLDFALEHPSGGQMAKVMKVYEGGLKVKVPAHKINNKHYKEGEFVFVTAPKMSGAVNMEIHAIDPGMNSGILYLGSMSSHMMENEMGFREDLLPESKEVSKKVLSESFDKFGLLEDCAQTADNWQGDGCKNYDDSKDVCLDKCDEAKDFKAQAKKAIEKDMPLIHDVASEHGQMADNVKHMSWFVDAVAKRLEQDSKHK